MSGGRFAGRTVVVTGAGRGIGQAIARRFAGEGARLVLVGRTEGPLAETAEGMPEALVQPADVADGEAMRAVVAGALDRFGSVDVVVNNAGVAEESPFLATREASWRAVLDTNLTGAFLLSQAAARAMAKRGGGAIVHNASIAASAADGAYASYAASKAGLVSLTQSMAVELAPHGIRVNAISPGYTDTDMTSASAGPETARHLAEAFDRVPLRRLVRPEEVAAACAFLASDEASAVTGANLVVDGGLTANWYILETLPEGS